MKISLLFHLMSQTNLNAKKVKEGIVFTTFHFPEHMVNMVTGHGKDEETMCAEYKVSSVEVQKISNQFKTEVKPKENRAEVK